MKREIVFKMERPGLVEEGQVVEVSESVTPFNVNYMIEPAVAMSGLFQLNNRLKADHGTVKKIEENAGLCIYNLGTGHGYSVLDIVKNFEAATGVKIPYTIKPRRPGDIATCYCDPSKAKRELGWEAQYGIKEMCADSWRWQKNNPNGYDD